jgi:hypothetical protein
MSEPLTFETHVSQSGDALRLIGFCVSILLIVGGVIGFIGAPAKLLSLVAVSLGGAVFVALMRKEPRATYAEYAWVNEHGFRYAHTPGVTGGRVSNLDWAEIESASRCDDPVGILIVSRRRELGGIPIFFAMPLRDAEVAITEIERRTQRGGNAV